MGLQPTSAVGRRKRLPLALAAESRYVIRTMLLTEAIESLASLPEDATLFAELVDGHFSPASRAVSLELTDEEHETPIVEVAQRRAPGKCYFLEVSVAREALEGWRSMRGVDRLTPDEATRLVIYYAEHDAWPELDAG